MPGYFAERRGRGRLVQAKVPAALLLCCWGLAGCRDPLAGPVDLFHDLEGGEIAAARPPPPGAGLPYPKLGTVPARPVMPDPAYRRGLQAQLAAERDRTERVAAAQPVVPVVVPPVPAAVLAPVPALPDAAAALPGQTQVAAASLETAEAAAPKIGAPVVAGPAEGAPLQIVGAKTDMAGVPDLPASPPPPASFEGVAAEPAPTPLVLPAGGAGVPAGTPIFFAEGSDVVTPSQAQAVRDFLNHRHGGGVEVIGLGEARSDTPEGQAAAIGLGLKRAQAVAALLAGMHVHDVRLGARAFGRGVILR